MLTRIDLCCDATAVGNCCHFDQALYLDNLYLNLSNSVVPSRLPAVSGIRAGNGYCRTAPGFTHMPASLYELG